MVRKPSIFAISLALLTLIAVAGGFTSFQRKRSSFERLDFSAHRQAGVMIVDEVDAGSGAERTGLRAGDTILAVDGQPAGESAGFKKPLHKFDEPVTLLVSRGARTLAMQYVAPELKIDYSYLI